MLTQNAKPAEVMRGCVFSERFRSAADIAKNGGVITGGLTYNLDGVLFSGSQKIVYPAKDNVKTVSFWITLTSTTESILKLSSSHSISVAAGTLAATGFAAPTIRVNGVATTTITTAKSFVEIDTATAITCNDIQVGYIAAYGNFRMKGLKFWNVQLTAQEALDYYTNSTFTYDKKATCILPMTMECHDATNLRTLDVSGKGNHATFGNGVTPATYPTKLPKRGYNLFFNDYFQTANNLTMTGSCTIVRASIIPPIGLAQINGLIGIKQAENNQLGLITDWTDRKLYILGPGTGASYSLGALTWDFAGFCTAAVVYDVSGTSGPTRLLGYVNGVKRIGATTGDVALSMNLTGPLLVGKWVLVGVDKLDATNDCLFAAVYPFALTPLQMADLHLRLQKQANMS